MTARTPLLLATTALLGCPQINNDCSEFNPFFCVKDIPVDSTGETGDSTTNLPTTTATTVTSEEPTSTSSSSGETTDSATITEPACDLDEKCEPGEAQESCSDCMFCSNGAVDDGEECDDGNGNNEDTCVACNLAICGDGYIQAGVEFCDDGEMNSDEYTLEKHCNASCSAFFPYCGDMDCQSEHAENVESCSKDCTGTCGNGIIEFPETCDENGETATCDENCTDVVCGDESVNEAAGEMCDDGNDEDTDECVSGCVPATCGDGFVHADFEECDDKNDIETDLCSADCKTIVHRRAFVSSIVYRVDDNDEHLSDEFNGVIGANLRCQNLADEEMLGGKFKAWLSDSANGPAGFFDTNFSGIYELVDGTVVANGWTELSSGKLKHAIDRDEKNQPKAMNGVNVWTNTKFDGTSLSINDCSGWTQKSFTVRVGKSNFSDARWTNNKNNNTDVTVPCNSSNSIYCIEDDK